MKEKDISQLQHLLTEREKELDALYQLAYLFARPVEDIRSLLKETAGILRTAMQHPSSSQVEVSADEQYILLDAAGSETDSFQISKGYSMEKQVELKVTYYRGGDELADELQIDEREQHLIESTAVLLSDVLQRKDMDQVMRESTKVLQNQAEELEHKNIALKEVLSQIEYEKQETLKHARSHISMFIQPHLHHLKNSSTLSSQDLSVISQLERSLQNLFTSEDMSLIKLGQKLSPREIEICGFIRDGLTTKEIASFLQITEVTVERHRNTIRKKLDLNRKKINLITYLRSIQ